jgi:hypothetical protein
MWYSNLEKAFISRHILHQHRYTCPITLPVCRNTAHLSFDCCLSNLNLTTDSVDKLQINGRIHKYYLQQWLTVTVDKNIRHVATRNTVPREALLNGGDGHCSYNTHVMLLRGTLLMESFSQRRWWSLFTQHACHVATRNTAYGKPFSAAVMVTVHTTRMSCCYEKHCLWKAFLSSGDGHCSYDTSCCFITHCTQNFATLAIISMTIEGP